MPSLNSHTHCQAAQANGTSQSLSISVSERTHGLKRKCTIAQHCIKAIAGVAVNSRSVHLINFCVGGQVIIFKSATALILDRYRKTLKVSHSANLKRHKRDDFFMFLKMLSCAFV